MIVASFRSFLPSSTKVALVLWNPRCFDRNGMWEMSGNSSFMVDQHRSSTGDLDFSRCRNQRESFGGLLGRQNSGKGGSRAHGH
jgi:hypothetical protein